MRALRSFQLAIGSAATIAALVFLSAGCGGSGGGSSAPPAGEAPAAFDLASATAHCGPTGPAVQLVWAASARADAFVVVRDGVARTGDLPATTLAYEDGAGLVAGRSYSYVIRARNAAGATDSPARGVSIPADVCVTPPLPPGDFALTVLPPSCSGGAPAIGLWWTESARATGYEVFRDDARIAFGPALMGRGYLDTAVLVGEEYVYRVRALNAVPPGTDSNVAAGVVPTGMLCPPGDFQVTLAPECAAGVPAVRLGWTEAVGALGYEIRRDDLPGAAVALAPDAREFLDARGLVGGGNYFYVVAALGAGDLEKVVGPLEAALPWDVCPPVVPGEFTVKGVAECGAAVPQIRLTWTAAAGADSYVVNRADFPSFTVGADAREYVDDRGVVPGASVVYNVAAVNLAGERLVGPVAVDVPLDVCTPFEITSITQVPAGAFHTITVTWSVLPGATYDVFRDGVSLATGLAAGTNHYDDPGHYSHAAHTYYIVAHVGAATAQTAPRTFAIP